MKLDSGGWFCRRFKWLEFCECVSPDPEARDRRLIWLNDIASGFECADDAPERLPCDQRRSRLDHNRRVGLQFRFQKVVKASGVEFTECEVVRIGEIDDRDIERLGVCRVE